MGRAQTQRESISQHYSHWAQRVTSVIVVTFLIGNSLIDLKSSGEGS